MNNRTKICIGVLIILITLSVWYLYGSWLDPDTYYENSLLGVADNPDKLPIDPVAAADDPEAEAMARLLFIDTEIQKISRLVSLYPENEFFLFQLIYRLYPEEGIEPQISLALMEKLIGMDPNNAHYHYLKAALHFSQIIPEPQKAWTEIEIANRSPHYNLSFSQYMSRIDKIINHDRWESYIKESEHGFYRQLMNSLIDQIRESLRQFDKSKGRKYVNAGTDMGNQLLSNPFSRTFVLLGNGLVTVIQRELLLYGEPGDDAKEKIYHYFGRRIATLRLDMQIGNDIDRNMRQALVVELGRQFIFTYLILTFVSWIVFFILGRLRNRKKYGRINMGRVLFLPIIILVYLLLIFYLNWDGRRLSDLKFDTELHGNLYQYFIYLPLVAWIGIGLASRQAKKESKKNLFKHWKSIALGMFIVWASITVCILYLCWQDLRMNNWFPILYFTLICFSLGAVALLICGGYQYLPRRNLKFSRVLELIFLTALCTGLTQAFLIQGNWNVVLAVSFLFIWFAMIITACPKPYGVFSCLGFLKRIFSKKDDMAIARSRMLRLLSVFFALCYITLFALNYLLVSSFHKIEALMNPRAGLDNIPVVNQNTYESMITKAYLYDLKPEDLKTILPKRQKNTNEQFFKEDLLQAIEMYTPSALEVVLDFIDDPNCPEALIARARCGDYSCKNDLLKQYHINLTKLKNSEDYIYDIFGGFPLEEKFLSNSFKVSMALHHISPWEETNRRLRELIDAIDWPKLRTQTFHVDYDIYECLYDLSRPQAAQILNYYLTKTDFYDLRSNVCLDRLSDALIYYSDRKLACKILNVIKHDSLIEKPNMELLPLAAKNDEFLKEIMGPRDYTYEIHRAIARHFDSAAIPLLREFLDISNNDLRAFIISQLNRLDHAWSPQELEKLTHDEYWKVRLNMLLYLDNAKLQQACQDENPIVRTVAQLLAKSLNPKPVTSDLQL